MSSCAPHPHRLKRKSWLLAVWEGFLMLWFLMMCLFIITLILKHPEIFGVDAGKTAAQLPLLVRLVKEALSESGFGLLLFLLGLSTGFGVVTLVSHEAPASRFFRWVVIGIATLLCIALMPVHDQLTVIGGGENAGSTWWTVIWSAAGILPTWLGIRYARRHMA
jgi:hypothetical protein